MIWSQHHIITDGWSSAIILNQFLKLYESLIQGAKISLPLQSAYRDYIAWIQKQDMEKTKQFWTTYLAPIESTTKLSFKEMIFEPIHTTDYNHDTFDLILNEELTQKLLCIAKERNLTLNTLIQGAIGYVIGTYTGQLNIVLGVTFSGRSTPLPGIEEMVGLFINTLPLYIQINKETSILSYLQKLQKDTQLLNEYAYTSLAQIQSWKGIEGGLFNTLFVFENYPFEDHHLQDKDVFSIKNVKGIEKTEYPLTITVGPGKELYIGLSYQTEHFTKEIIARLGIVPPEVKNIKQQFLRRDPSSFFPFAA
jgi:uncharacterized membrane protein